MGELVEAGLRGDVVAATTERPARRRGRQATIAAIVGAARELFSERGLAAVSLRDIADRADVNYGLVYQYVGTREDLLNLVFAESSERAGAEIATATDVPSALATLRRGGGRGTNYARMLAWALLEGRDPIDFHGRSPALSAVVDLVERNPGQAEPSHDARVVVAAAMVQSLG